MEVKKPNTRNFPLALGIVSCAVFCAGIMLIPANSMLKGGLVRYALSALLILIMWPALGAKWLKFPGSGWKETFKLWKWVLIIPGAFMLIFSVMMIVLSFFPEEAAGISAPSLNPNWIIDISKMLFCMISVGIGEELAFRRGLFASGVLQFSGAKNRYMLMAVISSLIFGFVHVAGSMSLNTFVVLGVVLKTLQAGMFGFIMCASLVESENIWPLALVHALSDFFLTAPSILSQGNTSNTGYVFDSASSNAVNSYIITLLFIILYISPVIRSVRILKGHDMSMQTDITNDTSTQH